MLTIQIKEDIYNLPNGWEDVTVGMYNKISDLENKEDGLYQYHLLSILMSVNIKVLYDNLSDTNGMIQLINTLDWIYEEISILETAPHIKVGEREYILLEDFNNIKFGEWVSIETLFKSNPTEAITNILSILYRCEDKDLKSLTKHINNEVIIIEVISVMTKFLEFRKNLYCQYDGYFDMKKNKKEEDIEEEIDRRAGLTKSTDLSDFMWMMMTQQVCEKLNYNSDEVFGKKLFEILNWLSMFKAKQDYTNEQRKKNK